VHDYWIQPKTFSKAITKHHCRERIKQKRKQELNRSVSKSWPTDEPTKTVKHHKATTFGPQTYRSER